MLNSLATKLQGFTDLSDGDRGALTGLRLDLREVASGRDLLLEGDYPVGFYLLLEGWACRYKLLPDGKRQIVSFLIPGDLTGVQAFVLGRMDHSLSVLSPAKVALISPKLMRETMQTHPRIARALWSTTLVDAATIREWLVNVGRRGPDERVAHLLCEMWVRMRDVGLVTAGRFSLPLTQVDIGETVALTPVTVNRVLQRLRRADLISLRDGTLSILDADQLMAVGEFDPTYLRADDREARARSDH